MHDLFATDLISFKIQCRKNYEYRKLMAIPGEVSELQQEFFFFDSERPLADTWGYSALHCRQASWKPAKRGLLSSEIR